MHKPLALPFSALSLLTRFALRLPAFSSEHLIVAASVYWALACNSSFWRVLLAGRSWMEPASWRLAAGALVAVVALQALLLSLLVSRRSAKFVLAALLPASAAASHFGLRYATVFDAGMLRNVLETDMHEALELLSPALAGDLLLYGIAPAALLWRLPLRQRGWQQALAARGLFIATALFAAVLAMMSSFQDLAAAVRNDRALRYHLTPANLLVGLPRAMAGPGATQQARVRISEDARLRAPEVSAKPRLLVLVVGETARAANWGLNGYRRQTTPRLAAAGVLNFSAVKACGASTGVSLPCMFSRTGRRDYDAQRIQREESLLHLLAWAGVAVTWRDNQSGCKGVCDGLPVRSAAALAEASRCVGERCLDEVLLHQLENDIAAGRDTVLVLHQLGSHGPAYWRRHPPAFTRFQPGCTSADLGRCTQQQIVNSYDNTLLYTDHVLAQLVERLKAVQTHDTAMLYVSDHGESLGEKGLYLHGMPYALAPAEQLQVPMVWWLSERFRAAAQLDMACLQRRAAQPASHDHLFHSILGLLQVSTSAYEARYDLGAACRAMAERSNAV